MKEEKLIRKRNLKGSVLFTVVAVMMVMIVFVMATLTIAGAANKRAYSSYSKSQTTYTARAAVDSVYNVLVKDDATTATAQEKAFAKSINGINKKNDKKEITITLPSEIGTVGYYDSSGTFQQGKILVECVDDSYSQPQIDTTTGKVDDDTRQLLKITATSILSDEESTVSLYLVKNPVVNQPTSSGAGAGLISKGAASNGSSALAVGGGTTINLGKSKWESYGNYRNTTFQNNSAHLIGSSSIIGSLYVGSDTKYSFDELGSGLSVFGNLTMQRDGLNFDSVVTVDDSTDYNKIPYIYVEGKFAYDVNNGTNVGSASTPVNIYVGGYMTAEAGNFYSDIYIYNHDFVKDASEDNITAKEYTDNTYKTNIMADGWSWNDGSHVSKIYTNANDSKLVDWINGTLTNQNVRQAGGNIYTKGSLQLGQNSSFTVEGDVYVGRDLMFVKGKVDGSITCKGTAWFHGDSYVDGLYVDNPDTNLHCDGTINGVSMSGKTGSEFQQAVNDAVSSKGVSKTLETATSFPAEKELPEILGYGTSTNQIVSTKDDLNTSYDLSSHKTSMDSTPTTTYSLSSIDSYGIKTTVGDIQNTSLANPNSDNYIKDVLGDAGSIYYIDSSCNLQGELSGNKVLYIDPSSDIWVNLDNVNITNGAAIVVNSKASGNVNFYIANGKKLTIGNSGNTGFLMTSYYYNIYKKGLSLDIKKTPDITTDEKYMIPNVYIYAGDGSTGTPEIDYGNRPASITAYIYAPNLKFYVNQSTNDFKSPTYNGVSISTDIAVIGATIVGEISSSNTPGLFYVDASSLNSTPTPTAIPDLTVLKAYYQNS